MSDGVMTYEDWLRGCVHHDGRNGYVTLPCDEVLKIADFIERLRKAEQTEPQTEGDRYWLSLVQNVVDGKMSDAEANQAWLEYINHKYVPQTETGTDCGWK